MTAALNWPKKVLPLADESLAGFLNRFARENGMASRRQLLSALDFPLALHVRSQDLGKLSDLLGLAHSQLLEIAWVDQPPKAVQRRCMLRAMGESVCPDCLQESPHSRQLWSHRLATCCPNHGHRLIDRCPVCAGPIRHDRWHPQFCDCGTDLRLQKSAQGTAGERIFSDLLRGETPQFDTPLDLTQGVPADIDLFVLGQLKHLNGFSGDRGKTGLLALPSRVHEISHALMPVFDMLESGVPAVEVQFQELIASAGVKSSGPSKRFGRWYKLLFRTFNGTAYAPWRQCAAQLIAINASVLVNTRTRHIQALASKGKGWLSVAEAARILKVSAERLHAGIDAGLIQAQEQGDSPTYRQRFLELVEVERLKQLRASYLDDTAARQLLDVPKSVFRLMNEAGWFVRCEPHQLAPVLSGTIQRMELQSLADRLRDSFTRSQSNLTSLQTVALRDLTLQKTVERRRLVDVYKEIAAGVIRPVGHDGSEGVGGVLLSLSDIDDRMNRSALVPAFTIEQVSSLTGAHPDAIKGWINDGMLLANKAKDQHGAPWQVPIQELVVFLMNYASLAHLAGKCGSTSRGISAMLAKSNVLTYRPSTKRGDLVRQIDLLQGLVGRIT